MSVDDTQQLPRHQTQQLPKTVVVRHTRRVGIVILGGIFITLGIVLIPLPGPFTVPALLLGLTIWSWEFGWAKRLLYRIKSRMKKIGSRAHTRRVR